MRNTDIQLQEMREEERDEADNGDVVGVELISEFWEKQVRVSIIFVEEPTDLLPMSMDSGLSNLKMCCIPDERMTASTYRRAMSIQS